MAALILEETLCIILTGSDNAEKIRKEKTYVKDQGCKSKGDS